MACPVCLAVNDAPLVVLSCSHTLCADCADNSAAAGLASCPICRQPHLLDTATLRQRTSTYRSDYAAWRAKAAKGSVGEVQDITNTRVRNSCTKSTHGLHSSCAGDLATAAIEPLSAHWGAGAKDTATTGIGGVGEEGSMYEKIMRLSEAEGDRFDFHDCASRVARCWVAYYWLLLRFPLSFGWFLVRYNMLWEGRATGLVLTGCFYLVYPFAAFCLVLAKRVLGLDGGYVPAKGNIFFEPPPSRVTSLLWDYYKALSPPLAQFMMNRGDADAIAHSWYDHVTDKDFWRRHLERVGARVPMELGRWKELEGGAWGIEWCVPLRGHDVVIKVTDESNGIGDAFLLHGDSDGDGTISGPASLEAFMRADGVYKGREALILEWIRPAPEQEVHTLDIVTVAQPDGGIELLTLLYWGDCSDGKTSHATRAGYVVDAERERISATCKWYAPGFASMDAAQLAGRTFGLGHPLPGVARACQLMVEAHKSAMLEQPWLKMIGWDAMLAKGGPPVFFEGNYAQMRLPRRVFLSWDVMWQTLHRFA